MCIPNVPFCSWRAPRSRPKYGMPFRARGLRFFADRGHFGFSRGAKHKAPIPKGRARARGSSNGETVRPGVFAAAWRRATDSLAGRLLAGSNFARTRCGATMESPCTERRLVRILHTCNVGRIGMDVCRPCRARRFRGSLPSSESHPLWRRRPTGEKLRTANLGGRWRVISRLSVLLSRFLLTRPFFQSCKPEKCAVAARSGCRLGRR